MGRAIHKRGGSRATPQGIFRIPVFGYRDYSDTAMRFVTAKTADALLKAELATLISRDPFEVRLNQDKEVHRWSSPVLTYTDILNNVGLGDDENEIKDSRKKIQGWCSEGDNQASLLAYRLRPIRPEDEAKHPVKFPREGSDGHNGEIRRRIYAMMQRQGGRCPYCLGTFENKEGSFDHEFPKSRYEWDDRIWVPLPEGGYRPQNYALHIWCNQEKQAKCFDLPHTSEEILAALQECTEKGQQYHPVEIFNDGSVTVKKDFQELSRQAKELSSLTIGVGLQTSCSGRMHSSNKKKIRQAIRSRPAGFKGSHGSNDPQYFERETIRGLDYNDDAFTPSAENQEDDMFVTLAEIEGMAHEDVR
jgi:hypothetical protein